METPENVRGEIFSLDESKCNFYTEQDNLGESFPDFHLKLLSGAWFVLI